MKKFLILFVLLIALFAWVNESKAGGRVVFRARGFGPRETVVFRGHGGGFGARVFVAPPVVVEQRFFGSGFGFNSFGAFGSHCGF